MVETICLPRLSPDWVKKPEMPARDGLGNGAFNDVYSLNSNMFKNFFKAEMSQMCVG